MIIGRISLFTVAIGLALLLISADAAFPTKSPTRKPTIKPTHRPANTTDVLTDAPTDAPTNAPTDAVHTFNPTTTTGILTFNPTPTTGISTFNPTPTTGVSDTSRPTQYPTPTYFRHDSSEVNFNLYIQSFPLIYLTETTEGVIASELVEIVSSIEPPCVIKTLLYDTTSNGTHAADAVRRKLRATGASAAFPTKSPTKKPTLTPTLAPTSAPTAPTYYPSPAPTAPPTFSDDTLIIRIFIATKSPKSTKSSVESHMSSSFSTPALMTALNSVCNCSSAFSSIVVTYDVSISSMVIKVNDVSFSTLVNYSAEVDTDFVYWYTYFVLPSIAIIYISWLIMTVTADDNSEFQTYFYCFFSGLSTVNMLYDIGNTFSSCFHNYRYLWASVVVSWMLPSLCFLVSTVINNQLIPYYILDSYFGWWCLFKRYDLNIFWLWLGHSQGLPLINSRRLPISFEYHDSLPKLFVYVAIWLILIAMQLACLVPLFLWSLVLLPYTFVLLLTGLFLFQTKLLVHKAVWDRWSAMFTSRSGRFNKNIIYDTKYFNELLLTELIFNNVPQVHKLTWLSLLVTHPFIAY